MKKIVYIGILLFLCGCILSAQSPRLNRTPQDKTDQQEKVIITKRPLTDEEQSAFKAQKQKCIELTGSVIRNRNYPATLELVKLRMELEKLSPPSDIKANLRELQEIADALRMTARTSPTSRTIVKVPIDCMAFPQCPSCKGTGKVYRKNAFSTGMGDYFPCQGPSCDGGVIKKRVYRNKGQSGEPEYDMIFDPALGKEAFLLRLEKISAWLTLTELPEYIVERTTEPPKATPEK
jgi:hypothetical protein